MAHNQAALQYGPRSISFNPSRGLAIVASYDALPETMANVPPDIDLVVLETMQDFETAKGAIIGRPVILLFDSESPRWRKEAEEIIRGLGGCVQPLSMFIVPSLDLLRGDHVRLCPVDWLWNGYLARGKLHILAGVAGTGKTTLALSFAATLTCGGRWPDGSPARTAPVLVWSGEDDPTDTLAPRLKAMGADMSRIHFVCGVKDAQGRRAFDPATDIEILAEAVELIKPDLIIVDPIVSAVLGDSHKNSDTRRALQPLVDLAARHGLAVLGITHFSKGTGGKNPLERITGSLAFGALARVVMVAAKVEENQGGGRVFCRAKSNIGADDGGFHYDLALTDLPEGIQASHVVWGESLEGTARQLLNDAETMECGGGSLEEAGDMFVEASERTTALICAMESLCEEHGIDTNIVREFSETDQEFNYPYPKPDMKKVEMYQQKLSRLLPRQ